MAAGGGSYMDQYRRLKKRSDYKQYTIDDYRKLQKEIRLNLGSLGPDMDSDTLKERVGENHVRLCQITACLKVSRIIGTSYVMRSIPSS